MIYPVERSNSNLENISEMCNWWQQRLGLTDWAIKIQFKHMIDMRDEGMAESHGNLSRRIAHINMSLPESRSENSLPDDTETSIVHELLHIAFLAWHNATERLNLSEVEQNVCYEQPIDQLAETLVMFRRSSGHYFSFEWEDEA